MGVPGLRRKAVREVRTYGAIGRCTCSACHRGIEVVFNFCPWCGAELIRTEYMEVAKHGRDGGSRTA
jgi:rRNA maturation endonuclease Nob1